MMIIVQGSIVLLLIGCCYSAVPSEDEVLEALDKARTISLLERGLEQMERKLDRRGPDWCHMSRSHGQLNWCPMSMSHGQRKHGNANMDRSVNEALRAMRILRTQNGNTLKEVSHGQVLNVFKKINGDTCNVAEPPEECDPDVKYRSADGSCNNLRNPEWGMAGRSQERVVPNTYDDDLGTPRTVGINNAPLPNARTISNHIHNEANLTEVRSKHLTLHAMGFGQFLDHDLTLTPETSAVEHCCDEAERDDIDNCFNIISPEDDEFQPIFEKDHCIELKRSSPVLCPDSLSGGRPIRQQVNAITSFIDASNVYGSSLEQQKGLRDGEDGKGFLLKTTTRQSGERILDGDPADCELTEANQQCSKAGDARVNEVPCLTAYHYLFVKEHNRIANILKDFYPTPGSDEIIFQETRKLVIAIMQTITYDQFLSAILSDDAMTKYKLKSSEDYSYDAEQNPTIINAFAAAAYRMGHSWISPEMILFNNDYQPIDHGAVKTEETFHNPSLTYRPRAFDRLMYWLTGEASLETDRFMVEAVRSNLFLNKAEGFALDLAAINIQRGRDHGIGTYNDYREFCGLDRLADEWDNEPLDDFVEGIKDKLIEAGYESPADIDLFTGGLIEKSVEEAGGLGPTFECLIGEQFKRMKFGDRFWFQSRATGYNKKQIDEIRKYTLSNVLCANYGYSTVQYPNAFKNKNEMRKCDEIIDMNFTVFDPRRSRPSRPPRPPRPTPPPRGPPQKKNEIAIEDELLHLIKELEDEQ
ncbi:peroxidasin homolog pxn-1-like [Ruditapes philippinarum]|uniref:peroxidasin homolog pxn-1-like n=1 Tax=Ruditapes philippinarum TaxID=129788 RepID=UPI00295C1CB2|nr:peroxidasin homolog pxn-1-like [Ruditapes philippinarum]